MLEQLLSGYVIFSFAFILIYIALALMLHVQSSVTGIVNFGIVGFWGIGMYAVALLNLKLGIPYVIAVVLAVLITGAVAWVLGKIILDLDGQAVLVGTLAFATVVEHLSTSEKWLTNGVQGLGFIEYPFDFGQMTLAVFFLIMLAVTVVLFIYVKRMKAAPYGRLLLSISDNELLAKSLGKKTSQQKLTLFVVSSMVIGLFGCFVAPIYNYIFPRMITSSVTFTVWIALLLGGRKHIYGAIVGVLATYGLFDFVVETMMPIPTEYADVVPNIKFFLYGLMLMVVLMFRPLGVLGVEKRGEEQ